jgi:hypothetical protein
MIINKKINDSTHVFKFKKLDQDILFESWAQVVCPNHKKNTGVANTWAWVSAEHLGTPELLKSVWKWNKNKFGSWPLWVWWQIERNLDQLWCVCVCKMHGILIYLTHR